LHKCENVKPILNPSYHLNVNGILDYYVEKTRMMGSNRWQKSNYCFRRREIGQFIGFLTYN